jgi:hypothetical protein
MTRVSTELKHESSPSQNLASASHSRAVAVRAQLKVPHPLVCFTSLQTSGNRAAPYIVLLSALVPFHRLAIILSAPQKCARLKRNINHDRIKCVSALFDHAEALGVLLR